MYASSLAAHDSPQREKIITYGNNCQHHPCAKMATAFIKAALQGNDCGPSCYNFTPVLLLKCLKYVTGSFSFS